MTRNGFWYTYYLVRLQELAVSPESPIVSQCENDQFVCDSKNVQQSESDERLVG